MAIRFYTGLPGAGKTYEACKSEILEALKIKRRVVSNLRGLNVDAFSEMLGFDCTPYLVICDNSAPLSPDFYPTIDRAGTVAARGDLLVLDEVWRFYRLGEKLDKRILEFYAEHRQLVDNETGRGCDIVCICQTITIINKELVALSEARYEFANLKNIGVGGGYSMKTYIAGERKYMSISQHLYDKRIFNLYKSQDGILKDKAHDKRLNQLRGWKTYAWVFLCVFVTPYLLYKSYGLLSNGGIQSVKTVKPAGSVLSDGSLTPVPPPSAPASAPPRLVGVYTVNGVKGVIMYDENTKRYTTLTNPPMSAGVGEDIRLISPPTN